MVEHVSIRISPGRPATRLPYWFDKARAEDYVEYVVALRATDSPMAFMESIAGLDQYDRNLSLPEWIVGNYISLSRTRVRVYVRKGTIALLRMDIAATRLGATS